MGKTCNAWFTAIDAATLQSVRLVKRNLQLVSVKEATTGLLPNYDDPGLCIRHAFTELQGTGVARSKVDRVNVINLVSWLVKLV